MFLINAIYETFFKSRKEKESELRTKTQPINITISNITIDKSIDIEEFARELSTLRSKRVMY